MLNITKAGEPAFFQEFKTRYSPKNWEECAPIRLELREFMLSNEQTIRGEPLCVYCEKSVANSDCHIDHVKPKGVGEYSGLFDTYSNLTVSCNSKGRCGHSKQNRYDEKFINPIDENPQDFMTYEIPTGKIIPVDSSKKERVETTCEILRLNFCRELLQARKQVLLRLYQSEDRGRSFVDYYPEFPTLIEFYKREILS